MRAQSLCAVGLGLIGVWLLVQALASISIFIPLVLDAESATFLSRSMFAAPTLLAATGAALIFLNRKIAQLIIPADGRVDVATNDGLEELLIRLLGVWLCATAVADGAQRELGLALASAGESSWGTAGDLLSQLGAPAAWLDRVGYGTRLAIGAYLIVRASQLRAGWLGSQPPAA